MHSFSAIALFLCAFKVEIKMELAHEMNIYLSIEEMIEVIGEKSPEKLQGKRNVVELLDKDSNGIKGYAKSMR